MGFQSLGSLGFKVLRPCLSPKTCGVSPRRISWSGFLTHVLWVFRLSTGFFGFAKNLVRCSFEGMGEKEVGRFGLALQVCSGVVFQVLGD